MLKYLNLAAIAAWLGLSAPAIAAVGLPHSPDCVLSVAERAVVSAVIDGGSFELVDGRRVRLAAVQAPLLSRGRSNVADWPLASQARKHLSDRILHRTVDLAFDERGTDRHGDVLAYAFADGSNSLLQSLMVEAGVARVHTRPGTRKCAKTLLALEAEARNAKRGIWAHPFYDVRGPAELDRAVGTFQIVEGTILSAVERRDRIFLNFGNDYRTDFTVTISPRDARRLAKSGTLPLTWGAKRVRVRGWISLLNGPEMELTHAEQLEVLR